MTHDEFRRWLARQGARFVEGTRHTKVYFNGRISTLPRHGRKEIPAGTMNAIKRQLRLK
jgi:mRNA interferase HicA